MDLQSDGSDYFYPVQAGNQQRPLQKQGNLTVRKGSKVLGLTTKSTLKEQ